MLDNRIQELIRSKAGITDDEIADILENEGYTGFIRGWILV